MSKQISNGELAEIVTGLLVGRHASEQLDSTEKYSAFMTGLAQLICDHCGGAVSDYPADNTCEQWLIGITPNDSLPADGGVWGKFDPDGEFDPEGAMAPSSHEHFDQQIPTAVIWLEGGVVQWIASDSPMRYLVLDADIDGSNESMEVTMANGSVAEVIRSPYPVRADCLPSWVAGLLAEVESQS